VKRISQQNVLFPERGPRHEHQEEADFEAEKNESDGEKAVHE